jgi:hypothetical protein
VAQSNLFLIGDIPGFTPQIARLVSMMNYTRSTTLQAVAGLGIDELDYLHDPQSNSIGTLLAHIAAAEVGYQAATFHARELTPEEKQQWGTAIDLAERAREEIRGYEARRRTTTRFGLTEPSAANAGEFGASSIPARAIRHDSPAAR